MLHVSANFAKKDCHFFFPQILTWLRYLDFILLIFFLKPTKTLAVSDTSRAPSSFNFDFFTSKTSKGVA